MNDTQIRKRAVERAELVARLIRESMTNEVIAGLPKFDLFDEEDCVKNAYTSRVKYNLCGRCIHSDELRRCRASFGIKERTARVSFVPYRGETLGTVV